MTIGLESIKKFAKKFFEAEYDVQYQKFGGSREDVVSSLKTYGALIDSVVTTRLAFSKGSEDERKDLVRRKALAYALFDHPDRGEVWAIYASGPRSYSQDMLMEIFWVAEVDGHPKVVTKQGVMAEGKRDARIHATDGDPPPKASGRAAQEPRRRQAHSEIANRDPQLDNGIVATRR